MDDNGVCGRVLYPGMPTHVVQELNVGTVDITHISIHIGDSRWPSSYDFCLSSLRSQVRVSASSTQAGWPGRYYMCGVVEGFLCYFCTCQTLFGTIRKEKEMSSRFGIVPRCNMTKAVESDSKANSLTLYLNFSRTSFWAFAR